MLRLQPAAQSYAWGRIASKSEVASLAEAGGATIDQGKRYAELWMGTHPSCPSTVEGSGQTLNGWIAANPEALGKDTAEHFGSVDLPFLFKVLSVDTALSIQSHPDKQLAGRLHAERPEVYKDGNHKPEMALALSDFTALCGFVETPQLSAALESTPELRGLVGEAMSSLVASSGESELRKTALKEAFSALMMAEPSSVAAAARHLVARLSKQSDAGTQPLSTTEQLALRLNQQYPDDVGIFAAFFLNVVSLKPGQAMYLPANQPHAYVSGELVEAMATSDNVIRAGLTPKLRDTDVLCSSLTYSQGLPEVLDGEAASDTVRRYVPPFDEFEVRRVDIPAGTGTTLPSDPGPQVLFVQTGCGSARAYSSSTAPEAAGLRTSPQISRGHIYLVPANTVIELSAAGGDSGSEAQGGLLLWICAVNHRVYAQSLQLPQRSLGLPQEDEVEAAMMDAAKEISTAVPASV